MAISLTSSYVHFTPTSIHLVYAPDTQNFFLLGDPDVFTSIIIAVEPAVASVVTWEKGQREEGPPHISERVQKHLETT